MADVHDKKTRSYNMSRIKGKNTKPELQVRKFLHANGFRYRLHVKDLPDIVLPKYKTVIFVHGCFWHGHEGCTKSKLPLTRTRWWQKKILNNIANDKMAINSLLHNNWNIFVVWQCHISLNNLNKLSKKISKNSYTKAYLFNL